MMEMKEYFHMSKGDGELSYSQNSSVQAGVWLMNQHLVESAIQSLISEDNEIVLKGLNIADLGCGLGPVPMALVSLIHEVVDRKCKELSEVPKISPQLVIFMNDLPCNDFNMLFRDLLKLNVVNTKEKDNENVPSCFLMAAPGSYYEALFPRKCLHFVHANYALHWLSQVPPSLFNKHGTPINKENIYISDSSPKVVAKAYSSQFEQDFTRFLKRRSEEMAQNARMLLTHPGRPCSTCSSTWTPFEFKIITKALTSLVFEGLIKEEQLASFNFPCYFASIEQLKSIVRKDGSFAIEETKTVAFDVALEIEDMFERAQTIAKYLRAFSESLFSSHFGENLLSPLHDKLVDYAFQYLAQGQRLQNYAVSILLKKC